MIKQAAIEDLDVLSELAALLWNRHTVSELKEEFKSSMSKSRSRFFLKYLNNVPVGFACCQLRNDYVEGAKYYPVGYLEGIFIKHNTAAEDMPENCCRHAKIGLDNRDAGSLQAIANKIMRTVFASISNRAFAKPTGSSVLLRNCVRLISVYKAVPFFGRNKRDMSTPSDSRSLILISRPPA